MPVAVTGLVVGTQETLAEVAQRVVGQFEATLVISARAPVASAKSTHYRPPAIYSKSRSASDRGEWMATPPSVLP